MTEGLQLALGLSLVSLSIATARFLRDPIHPGVLVTALWGVLLTLFHLLPHAMRPVALDTTLLVAGGVVCFWLGCILIPNPVVTPDRHASWRTTLLRPVLFWTAFLGLPVYGLRALEIADSANISEIWFVNLRIALSFEDGDFLTYGPLAYLVPLAFSSTLIELIASRSTVFERKGWIVFTSSIAYAVLSTGRSYLLMLLISVSVVLVVQRRVSLHKVIYFGLAGIAFVFFGVGVLANKVAVDVVEGVNLTPLDSLALYVFSPLSALDYALSANVALDWGLNTFRSLFAVLKALGVNATVTPLVQEFVDVPQATNVYTVFHPYILDFGMPGALVALTAFGVFHSGIYGKAKNRDPRWVIAYALSIYPLGMQFFQDQYFSLLSTWVLFGALIALCFKPQLQTPVSIALSRRRPAIDVPEHLPWHPADRQG